MDKLKKLEDNSENFKKFCSIFYRDFQFDCYDFSCELRDCCECSAFQEKYEEYLQGEIDG